MLEQKKSYIEVVSAALATQADLSLVECATCLHFGRKSSGVRQKCTSREIFSKWVTTSSEKRVPLSPAE